MHVALFFPDRLPVRGYGGTQRAIVALTRGLAELGARVSLLAGAGSAVPEATLVPVDTRAARGPSFDIQPLVPPDSDILCAFSPLHVPPGLPWIWRLAGNRRPGERCPPNTLFVSADHARRHGGRTFVYNGVDPREYRFQPAKRDFDLFLGRLHRVKGYRWAVEGAKRSRRRLVVAGGWRPSFSRWIRYAGAVRGERRLALLAGARCLWMPALWDEPCANVLLEAMMCGTPILGTHRGSLPEIVTPDVGALGDSVEQLVQLARGIERIDPAACRARAERHFSHVAMAEGYLRVFGEYLRTGKMP
ncbi:MAG TPA: glycosyltransferase [Gemmatimonadales bacterium]|jgi:glycosyltransferase involved in cell wall biosynthesis